MRKSAHVTPLSGLLLFTITQAHAHIKRSQCCSMYARSLHAFPAAYRRAHFRAAAEAARGIAQGGRVRERFCHSSAWRDPY